MWEVLKFVFVAKKPEGFFFFKQLFPNIQFSALSLSSLPHIYNILGLTQIFFFSKKDSIMHYSEFILCIMPSWKEKQNKTTV